MGRLILRRPVSGGLGPLAQVKPGGQSESAGRHEINGVAEGAFGVRPD